MVQYHIPFLFLPRFQGKYLKSPREGKCHARLYRGCSILDSTPPFAAVDEGSANHLGLRL